MKARELIGKASFGPDVLKVIYQAFDDAWAEIASDYDAGAQAEAARTALAEPLLSVASKDSNDSLKRLALQLIASEKPYAQISN